MESNIYFFSPIFLKTFLHPINHFMIQANKNLPIFFFRMMKNFTFGELSAFVFVTKNHNNYYWSRVFFSFTNSKCRLKAKSELHLKSNQLFSSNSWKTTLKPHWNGLCSMKIRALIKSHGAFTVNIVVCISKESWLFVIVLANGKCG